MSERSNIRLVVLGVLLISLIGTLVARLSYMQLVAGSEYEAQAANNSTREVLNPAVRGLILDQRGRPLVANRISLVVSVDRLALAREDDDGAASIANLAQALDVSENQIRERMLPCGQEGAAAPPVCWDGSPYQPVPVATDVEPETALAIMERRADFPSVIAQLESVREYPQPFDANMAHILGYVGPVSQEQLDAQGESGDPARLRSRDLIGRNGLEAQYDANLRGIPGITSLAIDTAGRVTGTAGTSDPVAGNYDVTHIDARLQAVVEEELEAAVLRARESGNDGESGAAVVIDTQTGGVLSMASYPTYDPDLWVGGISARDYDILLERRALSSNAIQGTFPPGSTFKPITTVAAAEQGYDLTETYNCPSDYKVSSQTFRNFESEGFGPISFQRALEVSCNTVFYRLADEMWLKAGGNAAPLESADPIADAAQRFGLGTATGIDLPGEAPGLVSGRIEKQETWENRRDNWCADAKEGFPETRKSDAELADYYTALAKENCLDGFRWRNGDAINASIGQGDTAVTPLQMAMLYAAIANGGTLYQPHVAKAILTSSGEVVQEVLPEAIGQVADSETLAFLRTALAGVTAEGTGASSFGGFPLDQVPVASKTGSAQVFSDVSTISWYASFAPADNPRYAVVMMVTQGGTGSGTSGPSVRNIYEALFGVDGDRVNPKNSVLIDAAPASLLPVVRPDGTPVVPGIDDEAARLGRDQVVSRADSASRASP